MVCAGHVFNESSGVKAVLMLEGKINGVRTQNTAKKGLNRCQ